MRAFWLALAMCTGTGSCNFDAAFSRYCRDNPQCVRDAGAGPESGPETEPDVAPEAGPETAPEAGPESGPEVGPESGPEAGPDVAPAPDLPPETSPDRDAGMTIPPPKTCQQSSDCGTDEVCHPFGLVCMRLCRSTSECPGWLDNCTEIRDPRNGGAVLTPKVCQCSSAQNCSNYTNGFTCNFQDNLCEAMCGTSDDCARFQPPRVCDVVVGMCFRSLPSCTTNRECPVPSQPRCDLVSLRCAGCLASSDCEGRPDGLTRCSSSGACVPPR